MRKTVTSTNGRTCLVTGATSGMGRATAVALAQSGLTVVLVGRDHQKGTELVQAICRRTGTTADFIQTDLSSQEEIRRLAETYCARYERLDVLVNNVGALFMTRRVSVDGVEMTFALNHLAPFLLTNLLLDSLRSSPAARIVNIASYGHKQGHMDFSDLQFERRPYRGIDAYRQSKLANVLFTRELARRLAGTPVTANAVNPGNVATHFGLDNFGLLRGRALSVAEGLYLLAVRQSAEQGAQTAIYLATSPAVAGISGGYFEKRMQAESSPDSRDAAAARRLWDVSAELTSVRTHALHDKQCVSLGAVVG